MAKSLRAHRALQQGPRLVSKPARSTRLFRAAMFKAPRSCSNSLSASGKREVNASFRRMVHTKEITIILIINCYKNCNLKHVVML